MKEAIGIVAALLCFVAYAPYFKDIFSRKTLPHPYSWFVWGVTATLIFLLQITHQAGAGAYTTGTVAIISFIVCGLALKNNGRKGITLLDTVLLIAALTAASVWLFADRPTLSILLLVSADILGFIPSVRKAWGNPHEETMALWGINGIRHGLTLCALESYTLVTMLNPLTWLIGNFGFCSMLLARRRRKKLTAKHRRSNR